jgi:hypothetical protein
MILEQSENPIEVLTKIFRLHDGASVFVANAEVQATPRSKSSPHQKYIFLSVKSIHFSFLTPVA